MFQTQPTNADIVTDELCRIWRKSLPSRSRDDTERTQVEIAHGYDVYEAACNRSF